MNDYKEIKYAAGGGGVLGIVHVGVLKALIESGITINSIVGVSAGSLFGAAYFSNLYFNKSDPKNTLAATNNILFDFDMSKLKDKVGLSNIFNIFGRNARSFGFYKGNKLFDFVKDITGYLKFSELPDNQFYVTATEMYTGALAVFSKETTPDLSLADAVRASCSIQGVFVPHKIPYKLVRNAFFSNNTFDPDNQIQSRDSKKFSKNGYFYFWDGGNLGNCRTDIAAKIGEPDDLILGVSLTYNPKPNNKSFSPVDIIFKTISIMMRATENIAIELSDLQTDRPDIIIRPDKLDIDTTDFNISDDDKFKLIKSGYIETLVITNKLS